MVHPHNGVRPVHVCAVRKDGGVMTLLDALLTLKTPPSLCCTARQFEAMIDFVEHGPETPEQMRKWLDEGSDASRKAVET